MLNVLFAASLIAAAAASDQLAAGVLPKTILVAAATANTGGNLVKQLSLEGKVDIKAAVRSRDDVRATELAALPRVTVVVLDFDDVATVSAALAGVDRAFLVSAPFDNLQFERETDFLALAGAEGIPTVRVGTYTGLYGAGTKTSYGRAHHGIEAYADINGIPTVTLRRVNPRHDVSLQKAALSNHLYLFFFLLTSMCACARGASCIMTTSSFSGQTGSLTTCSSVPRRSKLRGKSPTRLPATGLRVRSLIHVTSRVQPPQS